MTTLPHSPGVESVQITILGGNTLDHIIHFVHTPRSYGTHATFCDTRRLNSALHRRPAASPMSGADQQRRFSPSPATAFFPVETASGCRTGLPDQFLIWLSQVTAVFEDGTDISRASSSASACYRCAANCRRAWAIAGADCDGLGEIFMYTVEAEGRGDPMARMDAGGFALQIG